MPLTKNKTKPSYNLGGEEELSPAEGNWAQGSLLAAEVQEEGGRMTDFY